jgi:hypothetical protein
MTLEAALGSAMNQPLAVSAEIENLIGRFEEAYFHGIPALLNSPFGGHLAFVCMCNGIEALAGFRFPREKGKGKRFRLFVELYFDNPHQLVSNDLWPTRNAIVHGFSPQPLALCRGQPENHLKSLDFPIVVDGQSTTVTRMTVNAESLFDAFRKAAKIYFAALAQDQSLQDRFELRRQDEGGGSLYVYQPTSAGAGPIT